MLIPSDFTKLLDFIYTTLGRCPQLLSRCGRVRISTPWLGSSASVQGVKIAEILTPFVSARTIQSIDFDSILGMLGADDARRLILNSLGVELGKFILSESDPNKRYGLLLWALGTCEGVERELNKDEGTLLIHDPSRSYGIYKGRVSGGDFDGVEAQVNLSELFAPEKRVRTSVIGLDRCERALRAYRHNEARDAMLALFARSLWDDKLMFKSLMLGCQTRFKKPKLSELIDEVIYGETPYETLVDALLYKVLTPADFRLRFGSPVRSKSDPHLCSESRRHRLANALYLLPFIDKEK